MNEQQQAIFFFLEQIGVNSGFKVKTKGAKSTVTISHPDGVIVENVVKALSCTLKVHSSITVSCVDLLTDSVNFSVTLANKA